MVRMLRLTSQANESAHFTSPSGGGRGRGFGDEDDDDSNEHRRQSSQVYRSYFCTWTRAMHAEALGSVHGRYLFHVSIRFLSVWGGARAATAIRSVDTDLPRLGGRLFFWILHARCMYMHMPTYGSLAFRCWRCVEPPNGCDPEHFIEIVGVDPADSSGQSSDPVLNEFRAVCGEAAQNVTLSPIRAD